MSNQTFILLDTSSTSPMQNAVQVTIEVDGTNAVLLIFGEKGCTFDYITLHLRKGQVVLEINDGNDEGEVLRSFCLDSLGKFSESIPAD